MTSCPEWSVTWSAKTKCHSSAAWIGVVQLWLILLYFRQVFLTFKLIWNLKTDLLTFYISSRSTRGCSIKWIKGIQIFQSLQIFKLIYIFQKYQRSETKLWFCANSGSLYRLHCNTIKILLLTILLSKFKILY